MGECLWVWVLLCLRGHFFTKLCSSSWLPSCVYQRRLETLYLIPWFRFTKYGSRRLLVVDHGRMLLLPLSPRSVPWRWYFYALEACFVEIGEGWRRRLAQGNSVSLKTSMPLNLKTLCLTGLDRNMVQVGTFNISNPVDKSCFLFHRRYVHYGSGSKVYFLASCSGKCFSLPVLSYASPKAVR